MLIDDLEEGPVWVSDTVAAGATRPAADDAGGCRTSSAEAPQDRVLTTGVAWL